MSESAFERLPARPSLEHLRKQAKALLAELRVNDPAATLAVAQLAIARRYGFASWPKLAAHIAALQPDSAPAPALDAHGLSRGAPFYRVDRGAGTLEPRQMLKDRGWDTLAAVIREQGLTGVRGNGYLTDHALECLAGIDSITRLDAGGTKGLTDTGLAHLAQMPQLEELDLSEYPGGSLTDHGLEVLRHLPALRRFAMCWQRGISDAGVANLSHCDRIEQVDLLGSPTGDGAINALRGKRRLRHFKTGRMVTDAGLALLRDIPAFRAWQGGEERYDLMTFGTAEPNFLMVDGPFSDAGFAALAGLEGLFGLGFFWHSPHLTPAGLAALPALPHLGALGCEGKLCDDTAMQHIARIPRLRMLMAQGTVASDAGFEALSRSATLEYLWGRECPNLRGRGFRALASLPSLKGLAVSCAAVDDDSLALLPAFPSLTWLLPMDVTDAGFRHVGGCEKLERLTCMYCRSTGDAATEHLTGLGRLKHYYAGQTRITDRSLEILAGITSLEEVQLSACAGITNAGLAHLARLPNLRQVSVDASATVTRAGIAAFRPGVRVDFWT